MSEQSPPTEHQVTRHPSVFVGVVPDWSRCDFRLLRLYDSVCDDGPRGNAGHAGTAEAAEGWHLLARALCVPPSLLQLLGLPPHLGLSLSFLSLRTKKKSFNVSINTIREMHCCINS